MVTEDTPKDSSWLIKVYEFKLSWLKCFRLKYLTYVERKIKKVFDKLIMINLYLIDLGNFKVGAGNVNLFSLYVNCKFPLQLTSAWL